MVAGARARVLIRQEAFLRVVIDVPRYLAPIQIDRAIVRWSIGNAFGLEFVGMSFDEKQRLEMLILTMKVAQPSGLSTEKHD